MIIIQLILFIALRKEVFADTAPALQEVPQIESKAELDQLIEGEFSEDFKGSPITLQVRDADVSDVLRLIGEASGFNIMIGEGVKGKLSLSLVDVPWNQALDVVLRTLRLGAERNRNVLRIVTLKNLAAEKTEEFLAKKATEANTFQVTQVVPVNYAKLSDLQKVLLKFSSTSDGSAEAPVSGRVEVDERTNSLVLQDTSKNVQKMKKLIQLLDLQSQQVFITAKIVEANESFSQLLSGSFGIGSLGASQSFMSFAGGNPLDSLMGSPGVFNSGTLISSTSNPVGGIVNGTVGFSPSVSFLPGVSRLNALLGLGEEEQQLKVISSPQLVVLNREKASILEGTPVLVPGVTTVNGVGTVPTATVQSANVSLSVRPTVTHDGNVLLDLNVSKDVPVVLPSGGQGVGARNMSTFVAVESGATLVIGGIYTLQTSKTAQGFPILRKIPLIGGLFGSESEQTTRSELLIFITPRILNPKDSTEPVT